MAAKESKESRVKNMNEPGMAEKEKLFMNALKVKNELGVARQAKQSYTCKV